MTEPKAVELTEDRVPFAGIETSIDELVEMYGGDVTAQRERARDFILPLRRGGGGAGIECTVSWAPSDERDAVVTLLCNRNVDAPRGQRVFLLVGSASYHGTVYVNGSKVGEHDGGHLPFAFEITNLVKWDAENVVAISVENELKPTRVPAGNMTTALGNFASYPRTTYDFFPFAGLDRPVVLYSLSQTHVEDVSVVTGIDGTSGRVQVTARLNEAVTAQGTVTLTGGAEPVRADLAFKDGVAEATLTVPKARLWSDKDPYLYELTVATDSDRYTLQVGIRTIAVDGGRILLNGQPVQMNGFGRH
jgi:beta-glucuronidase